MSENIENVIWYGIGAFDYFIKREHHEGPSSLMKTFTTKRENILSDEYIESINNQIATFNYSEDVLVQKRVEIKKNFKGRPIVLDPNEFDKRQVKFIFKLFKRGGYPILDALLLNISDRIENEEINTDHKLFTKTMKELKSFYYVHLIDDIDISYAFKYQSKVLELFNRIIDINEDFFTIVDEAKQKLYFLIRNSMCDLYRDESKREEIIFSLKLYEIIDFFTLFNWLEQLFPTTLLNYLLKQLEIDNKREAWPVNRYHCLKMFCLENIDPLDKEYLKIYDKYFVLDNDNAYLMVALRAQYLDNMPLCKKMFDKIDEDNLNEPLYRQYDDISLVLESSDDGDCRTYKNKDEILSIIESGDREKFEEYLDEFDISTLSGYCLNECTKQLLDGKNYNAIEAEVVLYKNATSLYSYLSRSSEYIKQQDIASLYLLSTILLNVNLMKESYILLKRILEIIDCDDVVVMDTLKLQLQTTKKFLGYIV
jgi:hypothetical protein